jgi:hypothetical protein
MKPFIQQIVSFARFTALCGCAIAITGTTYAESSRVVSIEEHWELRLAHPESDLSAPQTTMVISPDDNLEGVHFLFTINHRSDPDYEPGGVQVQLLDSGQLLESASAGTGPLSYEEEVVTWVHRLSLDGAYLKFQVRDGHSETWGEFGGNELTLSTPTSLTSLNGYRPGVSITESQVSYAENRVESLTLTKLVWVTDDGEVHELNAPIAVDTSLDK